MCIFLVSFFGLFLRRTGWCPPTLRKGIPFIQSTDSKVNLIQKYPYKHTRIMFNQMSVHPVAKLTYTINHHSGIWSLSPIYCSCKNHEKTPRSRSKETWRQLSGCLQHSFLAIEEKEREIHKLLYFWLPYYVFLDYFIVVASRTAKTNSVSLPSTWVIEGRKQVIGRTWMSFLSWPKRSSLNIFT